MYSKLICSLPLAFLFSLVILVCSQKGGPELDREPGGLPTLWFWTVDPALPWDVLGVSAYYPLPSPKSSHLLWWPPPSQEHTYAFAVTGSCLSLWTLYVSHDGELGS